MIRFTIFIIALLLAMGAIEPSAPWLVTLAVLSGIELLFWRPFFWIRRPLRPWRLRWVEEYDW
jgi:hypothetical protein